MDTRMFEKIVDKATNGIAPGHGWGPFEIPCPDCGHLNRVVMKLYTYDFTYCEKCDGKFEMAWLPGDCDIPCDGPWLVPVGWEAAMIFSNN